MAKTGTEEMLQRTENTPVVRTDFGNQPAWETIRDLICKPVNEGGQDFFAYVEFVENPAFQDLTAEELIALVPGDYNHSFLLVVDKSAATLPEFPILVVDLFEEPGRTFRAIPSEIQGIENNLAIANMSFYEFADNADSDGVFRGFPNSSN